MQGAIICFTNPFYITHPNITQIKEEMRDHSHILLKKKRQHVVIFPEWIYRREPQRK